jgi:2-isopropylmalate synthase
VRLRQGDVTVQGRGVSTDVLEASARAYVNAVNRVLLRRDSRQEQLKKELTPAGS